MEQFCLVYAYHLLRFCYYPGVFQMQMLHFADADMTATGEYRKQHVYSLHEHYRKYFAYTFHKRPGMGARKK